ncbi:MAG: cysteine--tRNA ligase [Actinobacteria bacterium]|nr:cysteine--tRNA ligase [Actinomycetota bacterium]
MRLSMYDTASREVQEIAPGKDSISMYCCGPTVYRDAHVGNLRTFILSDLIQRTLKLQGSTVKLIQNITDVGHMADDVTVEDKILQQAKKENIDPFEIARKYEAKFHYDLALLNIEPAAKYPRASETIDLMQKMILTLIENSFAYVGSDSNVYFSVKSFASYGAISGNKIDSLQPGHRYEYTDEGGKLFHADWALWKSAGDRTQMIWDSPWGPGFPGWHIECSAMSMDLLDNHVDVHIGGIDLRFPHHENERAQSNATTQSESVAFWVHGEHLLFEGRKMSKSAGNVILLTDITARGIDPLALRLVVLENRYRSQMDLTWDSIESAYITLKRWRKKVEMWGSSLIVKKDEEIYESFMNDLDTPRVIQRLRTLERDLTISDEIKRAIFLYADQVLALDIHVAKRLLVLPKNCEDLLEERKIARANKDWARSDALRDELAALGILVSDTSQGQEWEYI